MSCDICGRDSCCVGLHSIAEQERYAPALELFEKAREKRAEILEGEAEEEEDERGMNHGNDENQ